MRKKWVLLQVLAVLNAVYQYGTRPAEQDEGRQSDRILSSIFQPYLIARIPSVGSEWLAATGHVNCVHSRVHRRRRHQRYRRMSLRMALSQLIGILHTCGNRTAQTVLCYCSNMVYFYQLTVKSMLFYTMTECSGLMKEMLLMLSGDIEPNPGPAGQLTLEDLSEVIHAIYYARAKWYNIGLLLKLPVGKLDAIRSEFFAETDCLTEMCAYWLRHDPHPSWAALTKVLESPPLGEVHLAQQLREKYCRGEEELIHHFGPTPGPSLADAPPTSQGQLTMEDLGEVIQAMYDARDKWYIIGLQLRLSVERLSVIRREFSDATDCLTEMCSHWLRQNPCPSWEALIKVLESLSFGERHLAQQLRNKYCREREELIPCVNPTPGPSLPDAPPTSQETSPRKRPVPSQAEGQELAKRSRMEPSRLGIHHLKDIHEELAHVSHKWYDIGLQLNLPVGTLQKITEQYADPQTCLREMLKSWLVTVNPYPTWRTLVKVLKRRAVKEHSLADELMAKHCKGKWKERTHSLPETDTMVELFEVKREPSDDSAGSDTEGSFPGTALTLKAVLNALHSVSHKWSDIGLQLDVPVFQLHMIEIDILGAEERMLTMLDYWLNNATVPSWKALVDALKSPAVGERRLAKELEERYCNPDDKGSLGTLEYLMTKSDDPYVQSLAGVLPQKALQTKVEQVIEAKRYLQEMAKWKHWAENQEGVKVFPVESEALQHYLTHIVEVDLENVTTAVSWIHQQASYPSPMASRVVQSSLDELQRNVGEEYLRGFEAFAQARFIITGSSSQSFEWKGYGFKLHVPKGAFSEKQEGCKIDIKAGLAGQFEFPDGSQLLSCMYWLSCPQKFLEPVTLEIQHCGLIQNSSQSSDLHFVVAKCSQPQLPYKFKALDKGTFSPHSSYGSLQVSQFSFFGIFGKCPRYYSAVYYINKGRNRWYVDFVVTYNLEVHLEAIQTHYSSLAAVHGPHLEVEFESDRISLELPGSELPNGWAITPLGPPVILKQQVDDYKPRRRIPCCQLLVKCMECKEYVELEHRVNMQGAKNPFNFFTLTCTAEPESLAGVQGFSPKPTLLELVKVKVTNWYYLGLELRIEDAELQTIRRNSPQDQDACKCDMFRKWLRNYPDASYKRLIQALAELGENSEAHRLCKKYNIDMPQLEQ